MWNELRKMAWNTEKYKDKIPKTLEPLIAEARKHESFEDFERAYLGDLTHGQYWHITDDPNFTIQNIAPRDLSSMASGSGTTVGLMVSVNPSLWAAYFPNREFAAEIDMSRAIKDKDYTHVNRGFGHEFFIYNLDSISVKRVVPLKQALRIQNRYYDKYLPGSSEQLRKVWEFAKGNIGE